MFEKLTDLWNNRKKYKNINIYIGDMDNNICIDIVDNEKFEINEKGFQINNNIFISFERVLYIHSLEGIQE